MLPCARLVCACKRRDRSSIALPANYIKSGSSKLFVRVSKAGRLRRWNHHGDETHRPRLTLEATSAKWLGLQGLCRAVTKGSMKHRTVTLPESLERGDGEGDHASKNLERIICSASREKLLSWVWDFRMDSDEALSN
jgi:hypothetical protein